MKIGKYNLVGNPFTWKLLGLLVALIVLIASIVVIFVATVVSVLFIYFAIHGQVDNYLQGLFWLVAAKYSMEFCGWYLTWLAERRENGFLRR
jgi:hypothetical protein